MYNFLLKRKIELKTYLPPKKKKFVSMAEALAVVIKTKHEKLDKDYTVTFERSSPQVDRLLKQMEEGKDPKKKQVEEASSTKRTSPSKMTSSLDLDLLPSPATPSKVSWSNNKNEESPSSSSSSSSSTAQVCSPMKKNEAVKTNKTVTVAVGGSALDRLPISSSSYATALSQPSSSSEAVPPPPPAPDLDQAAMTRGFFFFFCYVHFEEKKIK